MLKISKAYRFAHFIILKISKLHGLRVYFYSGVNEFCQLVFIANVNAIKIIRSQRKSPFFKWHMQINGSFAANVAVVLVCRQVASQHRVPFTGNPNVRII